MKQRQSLDTLIVSSCLFFIGPSPVCCVFYALCCLLLKIDRGWRLGVEITDGRSHPLPQGTPGERKREWKGEKERHTAVECFTGRREGPAGTSHYLKVILFHTTKKSVPTNLLDPIWWSRGVNSSQETKRELHDANIIVLIIIFVYFSTTRRKSKGKKIVFM